jgi:hypothetical protein
MPLGSSSAAPAINPGPSAISNLMPLNRESADDRAGLVAVPSVLDTVELSINRLERRPTGPKLFADGW